MGKVNLSLLGDNLKAKSLPYGFATWNNENATFHMTLRLEKDQVVAEIFWIFKDKSLGSNIRSQEKYKKK